MKTPIDYTIKAKDKRRQIKTCFFVDLVILSQRQEKANKNVFFVDLVILSYILILEVLGCSY